MCVQRQAGEFYSLGERLELLPSTEDPTADLVLSSLDSLASERLCPPTGRQALCNGLSLLRQRK